MDLSQLSASVTAAAEELITVAKPKRGRIFVLGCSTSEVLGSKIGTARSPETAEAIIKALLQVTRAHGLYLAVQCCEHLNRALVVEEEAMDAFGLTQVTVHPVPEAGGSAASRAYELFEHPVVVESIRADLDCRPGPGYRADPDRHAFEAGSRARPSAGKKHRGSRTYGGPYPSTPDRGRTGKVYLSFMNVFNPACVRRHVPAGPSEKR